MNGSASKTVTGLMARSKEKHPMKRSEKAYSYQATVFRLSPDVTCVACLGLVMPNVRDSQATRRSLKPGTGWAPGNSKRY